MAYNPQQLRDIIEWDIPNWSAALSYWERHTAHRLASARVLEIGGRHGGLSLAMALNGAWVVCTDIAGPTDKALRKHTTYQVTDRIRYAYVDALRIPHRECFDVVIFKSVLGGIGRANQRERQAQAVAEMFLALKPGGELWFAENLVGSSLHQNLRRRWVHWGRDWRYVTLTEMLGFLSLFSSVTYTTVGFLGALGRTPWQRYLLGRLDRLGVDRMVPDGWRYIVAGLARK